MDWRQWSIQVWLVAGDTNTRYFHQVANGQRRANRIERLRMGDRVITGQTAVGQALADHFRSFFRWGPPNSWRWTGVEASRLSLDEQGSILGPFLVVEVRVAISGLNAKGTPGPDGIPVFFYKDCWDRVASDVMALMEVPRRICQDGPIKSGIYRLAAQSTRCWTGGRFSTHLIIQQHIFNHRQCPRESPKEASIGSHQSSSIRIHIGQANDGYHHHCGGNYCWLEKIGHSEIHMESGLRRGVWLSRLAFSLECF